MACMVRMLLLTLLLDVQYIYMDMLRPHLPIQEFSNG
ncbi:hypothetical protein SB6413_02856 [Klebsiella pasteurii]|nr:hypothetical protein [Klebsiella sp. 1400]VUS66433.1 hypothetical protein SB6407_03047 [Klebsiella pasteurii]VUT20919.1 hypothetical protein SB6413_02856 [Klebsiella pasteurii]